MAPNHAGALCYWSTREKWAILGQKWSVLMPNLTPNMLTRTNEVAKSGPNPILWALQPFPGLTTTATGYLEVLQYWSGIFLVTWRVKDPVSGIICQWDKYDVLVDFSATFSHWCHHFWVIFDPWFKNLSVLHVLWLMWYSGTVLQHTMSGAAQFSNFSTKNN